MMKPGIGSYDKFKELFDRYLEGGGQGAVPDPLFHRRASGDDRRGHAELALWLKKNGFRADQVQAFLPSPMASATAMYFTGKNPLRRITRTSETVHIPRGLKAAPAQGLPALPRCEQLAAAARGAAAHGPRGPDRQRQAAAHPGGPRQPGKPSAGSPAAGATARKNKNRSHGRRRPVARRSRIALIGAAIDLRSQIHELP